MSVVQRKACALGFALDGGPNFGLRAFYPQPTFSPSAGSAGGSGGSGSRGPRTCSQKAASSSSYDLRQSGTGTAQKRGGDNTCSQFLGGSDIAIPSLNVEDIGNLPILIVRPLKRH